jgi:hypothetical protein
VFALFIVAFISLSAIAVALVVSLISITFPLIIAISPPKLGIAMSSRKVMSVYIFVNAVYNVTNDVLSASTLTALVFKSVSIPIIV